MKKYLAIVFIISLTQMANAQSYHPFPAVDAVWYEFFQTEYASSSHRHIVLNNDTLIGNINYHKLYSYTPGYDTNYIGALGEDSLKRIFFYDVESHINFLMYDFSLGINDTIFYNDTIHAGSYYYPFPYYVISNIDSVFDGHHLRKRLYTTNGDIWYEGIGSINGLLTPITPLPTCYCDNDLVCFSQGDSIYYCPHDIDYIQSYHNPGVIVAYPNPASDYLTIECRLAGNKQVFLMSSSGSEIFRGNFQNDKFIMDTKGMKQGIYFLEILADDNYEIRKIIIE
jgi:hypothetical protein